MESLKTHIFNKNYVAGLRELNRLISEGKIGKIYLAADAEEHFKQKVFKSAGGIEIAEMSTRKELASMCGIRVGCAVIGVLKQQV